MRTEFYTAADSYRVQYLLLQKQRLSCAEKYATLFILMRQSVHHSQCISYAIFTGLEN